jgi:hypothetical protein
MAVFFNAADEFRGYAAPLREGFPRYRVGFAQFDDALAGGVFCCHEYSL